MKERRILGTVFVFLGGTLGLGFAPPAVWKEAAISLKPVACGFMGGVYVWTAPTWAEIEAAEQRDLGRSTR